MKPSLVLSLVLSFPATVYAHGFVSKVFIAGKEYTGNVPNANPRDSIVRQIDDTGPVKGAKNADTNCGHNGQRAALVADANPGDEISFEWKAGSDFSNWPHNTGPMMTYMASCGNTPCNDFDSTRARWFKIQQISKKSNGEWAQQDIMDGVAAKVTIPRTLAPGNYLIRHEILALHLANQRGGAEFYPSCTQLRVGGSQSGRPDDSELVSFPGAYDDNDPGVYVPEVYSQNLDYVIPGPPIANFVQNGASEGNPPPAPQPSSTSQQPRPGSSTRRPENTGTGRPTGTGTSNSPQATSDAPEPGLSPAIAPVICELRKPESQAPLFSRSTIRLDNILRAMGLRQ